MEDIVNSVKRVADIMSDITAASQEQSTGIEEVNRAIVQMDAITQQNAALVEQAAAAAESMEKQAMNLAHAVSVFILRGGEPEHVAAQPQVAMASANQKSAALSQAVATDVPMRFKKLETGKRLDDEWEKF